MKIVEKFRFGLKKTSGFLSTNIANILKSNKINQETLEEIESILLSADIGVEVTNLLVQKIKTTKNLEKTEEILNLLANEINLVLKPREKKLIRNDDLSPVILLFIGVNGSGKTTTIGKLISLIPKNRKILIGACDTFRAAAVDQLKNWTNKSNEDYHQGSLNQDPASVAFSTCQRI